MQLYLPIAGNSINILLMLGLGGMVGLSPACLGLVAGFS